MTPDSQRFFDILDCWHKTEFFIPFALSNVTERLGDNQTAAFISRTTPVTPTDLPLPPNTVFSGGDLYLGTFDKDDVQKVVDRLGGKPSLKFWIGWNGRMKPGLKQTLLLQPIRVLPVLH